MIRTTVLAVATFAVLAACGSSGSSGETTASDPETSAPSQTPTPTAPPTTEAPSSLKIGAELQADVLTASVLEYKKGFDSTSDGQRSDGLLVRMCNTGLSADDGEFIFSSITWSLLDDDEGRYAKIYSTSAPDSPQPAWPDTKLAEGKCAKGWILFSLPENTNVSSAAFSPNDEDLGTWSLSD